MLDLENSKIWFGQLKEKSGRKTMAFPRWVYKQKNGMKNKRSNHVEARTCVVMGDKTEWVGIEVCCKT